MRLPRLSRVAPPIAYLLGLLLLALLGATLVARGAATRPESKDMQYYWALHYWQSAFDALSAATGAGLLTYEFDRDYTADGRWTLTLIGFAGGLLFVVVAAAAECRLGLPTVANWKRPLLTSAAAWLISAGLCVAMALAWPSDAPHDTPGSVEPRGAPAAQAAAEGGASNAEQTAADNFARRARLALQIAASLGCGGGPHVATERPRLAVLGAMALCGPTLVLLIFTCIASPASHARSTATRRALLQQLLAGVTTYAIFAAAIFALERPRGAAAPTPAGTKNLTGQPVEARVIRAPTQVLAAGSAGVATESLTDKGVTDGTKLLLALLLLVGGGAATATGGLRWPLLASIFCAARPAAATPPNTETRASAATSPPPLTTATSATGDSAAEPCGPPCAKYGSRIAAARTLAGLLTLLLLTTVGLLILDAAVATRFSAPATLADALLDASSATLGGGLSSGVTASVTNRNLSSGLQQPTDLYQYGMVLLMAAMLAGRVLPLWIIHRCAVAARSGRPPCRP